MGGRQYDAIVVGARCAGSPAAMLLASRGYDVLLVDRATFPSDTISTHLVHPVGVAALARWGLLDRVVASGCPPVHTYSFDFGPVRLVGAPGTLESPVAYCPRRTVLDQILVEAAAGAGAEVREGFGVEEVLVEDGAVVGIRGSAKDGTTVTERARVVIGADGVRSLVARTVDARRYDEHPPLVCGYYSYWSGLPDDGHFAVFDRGDRGFAYTSTNDGLTMVVGGWPYAERDLHKGDVRGEYLRIFDRVPEFAERLRTGTQETRPVGTAVPNYFRQPYGPGWALVGDAAYNRDFLTAQGISDAFLGAEGLTAAIHEALSGTRPWDEALADHHRARDDRVKPMYELTLQIASLEPPPPEMQALFGAMAGNQEAMDGFAKVNAGTLSPVEFFSEENVGRIFAAAGAGAAG
jgi:flavin-dependent dehydrogenase